MTATAAITTYSDADFAAAFVYKQNGTAVDLTGSLLFLKARPGLDATVAEVDISLDSASIGGITITDAVNGKFQIEISRSILSRLTTQAYVHSLIRIRPDGLHERIWGGVITNIIGPSR
jgi:hypothetical protein